MTINSLMNIGKSALSATQTAISTTGNNIANLNTVGYSRQNVRFVDNVALNVRPGLLGQGVSAAEIYRNFNQFVENSYLDRFSQQNRWTEQSTIMASVESVFNEANSDGINSAMSAFFKDWNNLNLRPDDDPTRQSLLANADTLAKTIANARDALESMQHEMDAYIYQSVDQINELIEGIRQLNMQIARNTLPGQNPNQLLDQRDTMVRKLSELIDVDVISRGNDFTIMTKSGHTLVQGEVGYSLEVGAYRVENNLTPGSKYDGTIKIESSSPHEYTFEVLTPPAQKVDENGNLVVDADGNPVMNDGTMRVSLDGGKNWLRNPDGSYVEVPIPTQKDETAKFNGIEISFTADPANLAVGDRFEAISKTSVYWVSPTRDKLNITPMVMADGTDNTSRITGGKLAAYFNVRDENIGKYLDRLDALSNSLIWEVNSLHSQGAGQTFGYTIGNTQMRDVNKPLGSPTSGLDYYNRLTTGNIGFQIYDKEGKPLADPDGKLLPFGPLNFDTTGTPGAGIQNFDPSKHSLQDVANAINNAYKGTDANGNAIQYITADIVDGKLQLTAAPDYTFAVAEDTTGVLAALGINTFFQGSGSADIAVKADLMQDASFINASKVNSSGKINEGDNETALALYNLATRAVEISTIWEKNTQTLSGYYGSTVSVVGANTRTANFNASYNTALANDLDEQTAAISGVNLDEEMTSLIKFQHSYTAAAKLITTADEMLQTLLSLKQ